MAGFHFWLPSCLLFLSGSDRCTALTLSPCVHDGGNSLFAEVKSNTTTQFYCRGVQAGDTVLWKSMTRTTGGFTVGTCQPLTNSTPVDCQIGRMDAIFSARRTSDTEAVITVDLTQEERNDFLVHHRLGCRISNDANTTSCKMDVIVPAQGTCNVTFYTRTSPWKTVGQCHITIAQSSEDRYHCMWYRKRGSSPEEYRNQSEYGPGPGTCVFGETLPTDDTDYTYRVEVTPGEVSIDSSSSTDNETSETGTATKAAAMAGAIIIAAALALVV